MKILATYNEDDMPGRDIIILGYESVEDAGFPLEMMCLGIKSTGGDDTIFAFVPTEEELVWEMEQRWGNLETFKYFEVGIEEEGFWND